MLERIHNALRASAESFANYEPGKAESEAKADGDLVTEADNADNATLRELLPRKREGWLSEETIDGLGRLERDWGGSSILSTVPRSLFFDTPGGGSIGCVEEGVPVAGGILNPQTEKIIGGSGEGVL